MFYETRVSQKTVYAYMLPMPLIRISCIELTWPIMWFLTRVCSYLDPSAGGLLTLSALVMHGPSDPKYLGTTGQDATRKGDVHMRSDASKLRLRLPLSCILVGFSCLWKLC